ncbi:MAG: hypothetical protein WBV23_11140 [Desulfobaccales bacterium]
MGTILSENMPLFSILGVMGYPVCDSHKLPSQQSKDEGDREMGKKRYTPEQIIEKLEEALRAENRYWHSPRYYIHQASKRTKGREPIKPANPYD